MNSSGSMLMASAKRLMLTCCLLGALSTTASGAVTYIQNFDSGVDAWEQRNAAGTAVNFGAFVSSPGGQSGNGLKITESGYSVGIRRKVTGVVAGEEFTFSIYYNIPAASGTWGTVAPRAYVKQETGAGAAVGAVQYSSDLVRNGTWTQVTVTGTISATAEQVFIGIEGGTSFITFDWWIDTANFVSAVPGTPTLTWNGGGADDLFSNGLNWGGVAPSAGDAIIFDGVTRLSPSLDSSLSVSAIDFAAGAGAFSITRPGTEVLTTTGDIVNSSANLQTIGVPVTLSGTGRIINTGAAGIANTAGTVSASGITKTGSGTLTLQGGTSPNLAGSIAINGGGILVNSNEQIADSAVVSVANGATLGIADGVSETIKRVATGSLSAQSVAGNIVLGENAALTMAADASFNGAASASAVQINGGTGSVFTLASGELRWTPDNMVNTFEKLVIGTGAILRGGHGGNAWLPTDTMLGAVPASFMQDQITINGGQLGLNSVLVDETASLHPNRGITISGNTTIETFQGVYIPGKITGSGVLTHNGGGKLELAGLNDFSGGLKLGSGPVALANSSAAGTGIITFMQGGSLEASAPGLTFANQITTFNTGTAVNTFGGLIDYSISGDVILGIGTVNPILNVPSNTVTMSGVLKGIRGFDKAGDGTLVLSGENIFGGDMSVNAGTLHYASTGVTVAAADIAVNDGGTLSGSGTINGSVAVASGATISAGASTGTLNTGNLTWNGGANSVIEINDATGTAGSDPGWDLFNVNGTLTINATIGDKFNIDLVSLTGSSAGAAANFDGNSDYSWTIVATTGGIVGFDAAAFDISTANFANTFSGGFTVGVVGNNLVLNYSLSNPPLITVQPAASQTVASGTQVLISATVTGTEPLTYVWKKDGNTVTDGGDISGATTATLTINNSVPANSGSYVLSVSNSVGNDESDASALTVIDAPVITAQPSGATISEGGNFNPTATVTGGGAITYQWKKNGDNVVDGGNISGATTASLSITSVTVDQAGDYTLTAANEVGSDTSSAATLVVQAAPEITQQPQNQSVLEGEDATFTVSATGNDLEYQWRYNGEDITGATSSSLTVEDVQMAKVGYYSVKVSNNLGEEVSVSATLSISFVTTFFEDFEDGDMAGWTVVGAAMANADGEQNSVPEIGTRAAKTVHSGSQIKRTVPGMAGAFRLTAHIYDNGGKNANANVNRRNQINIWGTGTQIFMIGLHNAATPSPNDNLYQCRVRNGSTAGFFNMDAPSAPTRSVGWHEFTIERDADLSTIRFYVDGVLSKTITGADAATMSDFRVGFGAGSDADAGFGAAYFDGIQIAVPPAAATITAQPESVLADAGSTVEFSVTSTGATTYQWQKDGVNIAGATDATLTINNALKADEGNYTVIVANLAGPVTSDVATLTVNDPVILTQPEGVAVLAGANVSFSVAASGTGTLTYQWKKNGGDITGATDSTYNLTAVTTAEEGNYTVVVTGDAGFVTSDIAVLDVQEAVGIVAHPADVSVNEGASTSLSVTASGEPLNYQWFHNDVLIADATDSAYQISSATTGDAGQYKVEVSNDVGSLMSNPATLTVVEDTIAPVIKLVLPKKNGIYTDSSLMLTGTVLDAVGVVPESIQYILNGAAPELAASEFVAIKKATNWTASVNLEPGTNTIEVVATDLAGNPATFGPIPFYYHTTSQLLIQTNLNGVVITTNGVGAVLNKTPEKMYVGDNTTLFVGRTYKLQAVQSGMPKYILTNWTATWEGQASPVVLETNNLYCTFEMKSNMVVNANFIDNPFHRFGGLYHGLFSDTNNGVSFHSAGSIVIKVTDKQKFSAKLLVDGNGVAVSGKLNIDGTGTATGKTRIKIADKPQLTVSLKLDFEGGSDTISGTVSEEGGWTSHLLADRMVWSKTNVLEQADAYTNSYTMLFPGFTNNNEGPVGTGHGLIAIKAPGKTKILGYGGDFEKMKQATYVSKNGQLPYYSAMYPLKRTNELGKVIKETQGMKMGWLTLETNLVSGNLRPTGEIHWIKTDEWTNTTYTAGFTNVVDVLGSRWYHDKLAPADTLQAAMPYVILGFTDGDLGSSFTNAWSVSEKSTFKPIKFIKPDVYEYENLVKASVATKSGLFKGVFIHPETPLLKTKYLGAILQDENYGEGAFMGSTVSGKVTLDALFDAPEPPLVLE